MVEETFELTLLFDYYGDLLTQKQRSCFDLHYNQDLSLGEIAQEVGISRQGRTRHTDPGGSVAAPYGSENGLCRPGSCHGRGAFRHPVRRAAAFPRSVARGAGAGAEDSLAAASPF